MAKIKDENIAAIVARNIRTLRTVRNLSQKQLQERAGWQQQSIVWQLENGKIGVGPQTLAKLADALLVDPGLLFMDSLPEGEEVVEQLAKMDLKNIGGILINSLTRSQPDKLIDYIKIPLYDMQEVPPYESIAPKEYFPLLANDETLNPRNLVCIRIDKSWETPIGYNKGDIVCVDRGEWTGTERPYPKAETDQYVVKLGSGIDIYLVEGEGPGYRIINIDDVCDECGELPSEPIPVDLRGFPDAIIGRVIWAVKFMPKRIAPPSVVKSPADEESNRSDVEPCWSPDRSPREEEE
jgi:transcriptional regulator with XRE-family HTH domain